MNDQPFNKFIDDYGKEQFENVRGFSFSPVELCTNLFMVECWSNTIKLVFPDQADA